MAMVYYDVFAVAGAVGGGLSDFAGHEGGDWVADLHVGVGDVYAGVAVLVWDVDLAEFSGDVAFYWPGGGCGHLGDYLAAGVADFDQVCDGVEES